MAEELRLKAPFGSQAFAGLAQPDIDAKYAEYKQLVTRAVEVFGSEVEATRWLSNPSPDFDNRTPLQVFAERGSAHPLEVLGRIEHGIFF